MVTGKLSETLRSFAFRSGFRLKANALKTPQLEWRLAGGCPQPAAASVLFRIFSPGGLQERGLQSGAKKFAQLRADCNEIDCCYKALVRRKSVVLRGVNSMDKPNGRLVLVSYTHHCASTSSLSTRWSFWALQGDLILERASRLYAFSGYHNRTSLPSRALGRTTGTQEVRPSRSSRTKDSPPQISYAHSR
jgi:hypothetical protein